MEHTVSNLLEGLGYSVSTLGHVPVGTKPDGTKVCVVHPLWSHDRIEQLRRIIGGKPIVICDLANQLL